MPWIDEAWLRTALDAMRATFGHDPHQKKDMIQFLLDEGFWDPETLKSWDAAVSRFNDCLNPNKAQFFKFGEVWALMKRFDRHQLFHALAADLGYEVRQIPTEARRLALLERIAQAYEGCERTVGGAQTELMRLSGPQEPTQRSAPPSQGKVHFSVDDAPVDQTPAQRVGVL